MMLFRKQKLKVLRLIICLAVLVTASTLFTNLEPSASENLPIAENLKTHGAATIDTPSLMHRATCSVETELQSVYKAQIIKALASLPKEEAAAKPENADLQALSEEKASSEKDSSTPITPDEDVTLESSDAETEETADEDVIVPPAEPEKPTEPTIQPEEPVAPPVEETTTPGAYSDLDYLAAICQIEAGYNYDGCLAVANVILNRVNAGFGSSVYDVIYAPYQFATNQMDALLSGGTSSVAREAAAAALAGSNNVGSYLYFNGTAWLDPATLDCPYVVIGGNCFY